MTVIDDSRPKESGPEAYAPKRSIPNLRMLKRDVGRLVDEISGQPQRYEIEPASEPAANDANALIGRYARTSQEEIDRLILELQDLRDRLRQEGERVSREVGRYASLNHAVMNATKVITDHLAQMRATQ